MRTMYIGGFGIDLIDVVENKAICLSALLIFSINSFPFMLLFLLIFTFSLAKKINHQCLNLVLSHMAHKMY